MYWWEYLLVLFQVPQNAMEQVVDIDGKNFNNYLCSETIWIAGNSLELLLLNNKYCGKINNLGIGKRQKIGQSAAKLFLKNKKSNDYPLSKGSSIKQCEVNHLIR